MVYSNEAVLGILIIEDEKSFGEYLEHILKESFQDANVYLSLDFDKGISMLKQKRPDVLILDLYRGDPTGKDLAGGAIWDFIWKELFIPIIIYTAGVPNLEPEIPQDHPFVSYISKGAGSDKKVVDKIRSCQPCIYALKEVATEIDKATQVVLKDLSPLIWGSEADEATKHKLLVRGTRRRLGARMDLDTVLGGEPLLSWEQYIVPPLEDDLLMGDIIIIRKMRRMDPLAYRLVLSPSCDLTRRNGPPKLEHVLVAKCSKITNYTKSCGLSPNTEAKKIEDILLKDFRMPQRGGKIALPQLPSFLSPMAANLRDLELIKLTEIACSETERKDKSHFKYERVASMDSPFREQTSWAFLEIACRPGLPERDFSSFIKEIQSILDKEKK